MGGGAYIFLSLRATQNQCRQLFCQRDNAFFQYMSTIPACQRGLEMLNRPGSAMAKK